MCASPSAQTPTVPGVAQERLAAAQRGFWAAAFGPAQYSAQTADTHLSPSAHLSAAAAAEVYRDAVFVRHAIDLGHTFPMLKEGLGRAHFDALVARYLAATVARRPPLGRLGAELPTFLERIGAPAAQVDLAALEDMRAMVFAAPDVAPAGPEALQVPDLERRRFTFIRALARRTCTTDMAKLAASPAQVGDATACAAPPSTLVVWRQGLDIKHARLHGAAREALDLAAGGACIEVVLAAFHRAPDPSAAATAALGAWFADGWVANVA